MGENVLIIQQMMDYADILTINKAKVDPLGLSDA